MAVQWQLFDALDPDAFDGLKADIRERGVLVPVELDENGDILDGHHRVRAWTELKAAGVSVPEYPRLVRVGMDDAAKRRHVIALNLYRRHLSSESRGRYAIELNADGMSTRQIARIAGVNQSTVVRDIQRAQESGDAAASPERVTGKDGKSYPARKPHATVLVRNMRQLNAVIDAGLSGSLEMLPSGVIVASDHKAIRDGAKAIRKAERAAELASLPPVEIARTDVRLEVADGRAMPLDDASVDLIVTSPPYALDIPYDMGDVPAEEWPAFMAAWLREALRVAKPSGRLALNIPLDTSEPYYRPTYVEAVVAALAAGWEYASTVVWSENNSTKGGWALGSQSSAARPRHVSQVEMIALFSKGEWAPSSDNPDDITPDQFLEAGRGPWTFSGESRAWEDHPAAYPLELPRRLIRYLCRAGDVVLDPFVGSGSTAVAALELGRQVIGFDISTAYIESTKRRIGGA